MEQRANALLEVAAMENSRFNTERILAPNRAPLPPRELWVFVCRHLEAYGCDPVFWFRKILTASDENPNENRLLCRKTETLQVLRPALSTAEEDMVMGRNGKLQVVVIDQRGRQYDMKLTYWHSSGEYPLIGSWRNLVQANDWKKGTPVCVWFFRYGEERKLGFLITSP